MGEEESETRELWLEPIYEVDTDDNLEDTLLALVLDAGPDSSSSSSERAPLDLDLVLVLVRGSAS